MCSSESLLSFILRASHNKEYLSHFTAIDGIRILCENLVVSSKYYINNSSNTPGAIALVIQHLSSVLRIFIMLRQRMLAVKNPASVLLNQPRFLLKVKTPHRRSRTAAWSCHFYPELD